MEIVALLGFWFILGINRRSTSEGTISEHTSFISIRKYHFSYGERQIISIMYTLAYVMPTILVGRISITLTTQCLLMQQYLQMKA